ncbi:MAG: hypothetical protein CL942_15720 [Desulfovibrio sp.]|nr:hypothetical protein [Desulfovibrio sp.]|tara:strand:- start:1570 stop:3519 length:1950 start_codon:yes stop_codon:yes gene_type:complete
MAQPRDYTRQFNFNDFQATSPADPLPGVRVDAELNAVKLTLDDLNTNIAKIQRDDGKLGNQAVHKDAFDPGALALINVTGFSPQGDWTTARAYSVGDIVDFNSGTYLATAAHISSAAFATDSAANKWILIANAAISGTSSAVDKFEGDGATTVFTLTFSYASENSVQVFVNGELLNPVDDYTLSGNQLTLFTPPGLPTVSGNENVIVWGASVVGQAAAEAASASASNASGFADEADNWARKTTGLVENADYSSKAYAIGGTGVDNGDGSSKDWAIKLSSTVGNTNEYSAKYWATQGDVPIVAAGITNITTVAGQISPTNNIATLAGINADITTVSGISSDITTVSGISSDISTIAALNTSELSTLASNMGSVTTVSDNITSVVKVAQDLNEAISEVETVANDLNETTSEIEVVANSITNVNTVGQNISSINNLSPIVSDITGVNTISAAVTSVNNNSSNINTVSGAISNVNSLAGIASDISTVSGISSDVTQTAANFSGIADFAQTYKVSANQPTGSIEGTLWFDTTNDVMKVYDGNAFQNAGSSVNGTVESKQYVVGTNSGTYTGSLTTFPCSYDSGFVHLWLNGVKLQDGVDFTATDGANIVLNSAATNGDVVSIVAYGTFLLANHYSKTAVDALIDDVETLALAGI